MFSIMQRFITILNVKFDLSKRGVCLVHAQHGRGGGGGGGGGGGRRGERDGPTCLLLATIQDLGSLLKDGDSRGLILVSYGATVMRIPKQQLAMATLSCWRALLAEARNSKR